MPIIRPANPKEAASLTKLAMRSKAHWGYDAAFMERCCAELTLQTKQIETTPVYVIESSGSVRGFYALEKIAADRMELTFMFVEPACIGQGYGRVLIEHAKTYVRANGFSFLEIQGDPNAAGFYESAGAQRVGERPSASIPGRMLPIFVINVKSEPAVS